MDMHMSDVEWKAVIDRACSILQERRVRDESYLAANDNLNHVNIAKYIRAEIKLKETFADSTRQD